MILKARKGKREIKKMLGLEGTGRKITEEYRTNLIVSGTIQLVAFALSPLKRFNHSGT